MESPVVSESVSDFGIEMGDTPSFVKYVPTLDDALVMPYHPTPVVESATLAAVNLPLVTYKHKLPNTVQLSSLQMEAVILAGHAHQFMHQNKRDAMLILDGPGVGKGRTISGIIMDNYIQGRKKSIWITKSMELYTASLKDFGAIGFEEEHLRNFVAAFNTNKVLPESDSCLFLTYQSLQKDSLAKLEAIFKYFGSGYDGVIVFDECHNVKNSDSQAAKTIVTIDEFFPYARIVYSSATAVESVNELSYLNRLNLWGPGTVYPDGFFQMVTVLSKMGHVGIEAICMQLKRNGSYVSRRLDFSKVKFEIVQVPLDNKQVDVYNSCVELMANLKSEMDRRRWRGKPLHLMHYWREHQSFFKLLCLSFKVQLVVERAMDYIKSGKAVIIGLQSTGFETSRLIKSRKSKKIISLLREKLIKLFKKFEIHFGKHVTKRFLQRIRSLELPTNPLDTLLLELGIDKVAELTGRTHRMELFNGKYVWRAIQLPRNERIDNFLNGDKDIAIISSACSTGVSLHQTTLNGVPRDRVHMTLELPFSAEQMIQQCGRTFRSGQDSETVYELYVGDCAGEIRFGYGIARRLASLGAITQADRDLTINSIEVFNLNSSFANEAVNCTLRTISTELPTMIRCYNENLEFYKKAFFALQPVGLIKMDNRLNRPVALADVDISKFLNRLLGIKIPMQNELHVYFCEIYKSVIEHHKREGDYEDGALDFGPVLMINQEKLEVDPEIVLCVNSIQKDYGVTFEEALNIKNKDPGCKFFLGYIRRISTIYLAIPEVTGSMYSFLCPFGMLSIKQISPILTKSYNEICQKPDLDELERLWSIQYLSATCYHVRHKFPCATTTAGNHCNFGNRYRRFHVLTGLQWNNLQKVTQGLEESGMRAMQLARFLAVDSFDGSAQRYVGILVQFDAVPVIKKILMAMSENPEMEQE